MMQTHRVIFPSWLSHTHKLKDTFQKFLSSPDEKEKEEKGGSMSFFMCRWFKNPDVCKDIGSPQGSFGVSGTRCAVRGGKGLVLREGKVRVHIMTWRRRCRERWSDREKERSHSVQRKGLIPVCLRKCRVSSSERAKRQVQPSQVQW